MKIVDANLLIYAFDRLSPQHFEAKSWLENIYSEDDLIGLPLVVILAFLRITTNPRIMATPMSPSDALSKIESLLSHPKTIIVDRGAQHWSVFRNLVQSSGVFGPSITDAHLAALAIEHGATLCSHDEGFRRYANLKFENPLTSK